MSGPPPAAGEALAATEIRWPGAGGSTGAFGGDELSRDRLQAALTAGRTAAWHSDLLTRARWWSPEMLSIHGLGAMADVPDDYLELVHPDDRPAVEAAFRHSVATGAHEVQYRVLWPDGSVHWLEGVGRVTRDAGGRPQAILGTCSLIDGHKRQEADLRFLAQASAELARSTDYEETLRRLAALAVPHFADWCAVDMLDEAGELRRLAVAHADPAKVSLAQELHQRFPPPRDVPAGAWHVLRTGQAEFLAEISDELLQRSVRDAEHLAIVRSLGLRSYLGVPLVGADGVLGVISFVTSDSRRTYGPCELELATDLVSRAAVAIQNARLFQRLKQSQQRQAFLLALTDVLRGAGNTQQILSRVSEMLGRHFAVDRVGYGHVDEHLDRIDYDVCWTDGTVPPLFGRFPASAFGQAVIDRLLAGETIAIANVREHPYTSDQHALRTSHEVETRAILVVPLFKAGQLRTIVYLNQRPEREWTADEIALMEEVAERTRELIERGRAEEALRAGEARWRGLFETMTEGFFVAEAVREDGGRMRDFRFLQVNPAFEKLTGVPPAAAVGRTMTQVVPGVQQELIAAYERVVDTREPTEFEVMVPALDDRWYEARASWVAPDQFSVLFLEITERKRAQLEVAHAARRYQTLFDSIDEGFCILDVLFDAAGRAFDYRFIEVNPAFERQSGLVNAVGRTIRELVPAIDADYIETYGRVARTGEPLRFVSQARALNRWFDAFAFRIGEPEQHRVALLFTDITDRKQIEQALREADARKDEFLATLAHELRNPLAPLRNGLAILARAGVDEAAAQRARELMERQLTQLVRLVDDLLDVSRVSAGKVTMKKTATSLQAVVELALETARPLIEAGRHQLALALPPQPVLLHVDPTRLAQVLSNLLNNAAKYTPAGGRIALEATLPAPGRVLLAVRDNGVGIPPDMLERVFELFTQVGGALERAQGGLGIGLSLARRLVELHGGTIRAESAGAGQGSTFLVELPALDAAGEPGAPTGPAPAAASAAGARRILVVDDNRDAAETLGMLLELEGHRVQLAHGGRQAIELALRERPQLVFLDIGLPDLDGYQVAAALREQPALAGTLLVALTGWGAERDRARARAAGFHLHLTKPVTPEQIAAALDQARAQWQVQA